MRRLFTKAWFRWLLAALISGIFVFWLAANGVFARGGLGFFR